MCNSACESLLLVLAELAWVIPDVAHVQIGGITVYLCTYLYGTYCVSATAILASTSTFRYILDTYQVCTLFPGQFVVPGMSLVEPLR